ncbi:MAG: NADH-quinone oxidoreductase subunit K [Deltaproteobacteria bacterium]|nr:NADH-quinone oxidoreductase subunit K [Deltaproteobacteria bacterium]
MSALSPLLQAELAVGAGVLLVVLGLGAMLLRRSILIVVMGGVLALLGAALTLGTLAAARGDAVAAAAALLFVVLASAWSVAGAAVALTSYRRRGTENLDELRELRG